jgi:putative hydrolase of the HAD superfamily
MRLRIDRHTVVVFDLDDTLYDEREFVRSGLEHVQEHLRSAWNVALDESLFAVYCGGERDPIGAACKRHGLPADLKTELVSLLRAHAPRIALTEGARLLLAELRSRAVPIAVVTDGRSITQRRKLEALGIAQQLACIVVSEEIGSCKPDQRNFLRIAETVRGNRYIYIGDNPLKDVTGARALGWTTIGLEPCDKQIHFSTAVAQQAPKPDYTVKCLSELIAHIG